MAKAEDAIHTDEYTAADEAAAKKYLERFRYTTTAISVLEVALRKMDDAVAADLVGSITNRLAKHEASSL